MNIEAKIENVEYEPTLCQKLLSFTLENFKNGTAFKRASFVLDLGENKIGVSQWVSPKRTRSYPFARVYNTMNFKSRITIIPIVKDEGKKGDRDYLQWDTVSLMSLLGVYVIIAYYDKAKKNPRYENKITSQEFDYGYLTKKLKEFLNYKSDALHWNLKQLSNLKQVSKLCENAYYKKISRETGVDMHGINSFRKKIKEIYEDVEEFKKFSRDAAKSAQNREFQTIQPKEVVINEKAKITIANYQGGMYYFAVDEIMIKGDKLFLIEKKHSQKYIPSLGDIQDALIKMILYTNISEAKIDGNNYKIYPVIGLTSEEFTGILTSMDQKSKFVELTENLKPNTKETLRELFKEANRNNFFVFVINSKEEKEAQNQILDLIR